MKPSIIVYGPQGCGKTRNAAKIAKAFGLNRSEDLEDFAGRAIQVQAQGVLYLTNQAVKGSARQGLICIDYAKALAKAGA